MDQVSLAEKIKYEDVWRQPGYRRKAHGLELWETRREIFPPTVRRAIDLGCGHGRLFARWRQEGIDGWGVDFAEAALDPEIREAHGEFFRLQSLWELVLPGQFDLGVCADVMEHIPEEKVLKTIYEIEIYCRVAVFKIANFNSNFMGHELHPTKRPAEWWYERLVATGRPVERLEIESTREDYLFRMGPR